jgi:nucleotide-binding universal stress UspA family protein
MPYKEVLVFADGSRASAKALDVAASLADAHDAHLVALHVTAPPFVPVDIGGGVPADLVRWQERFANEQAEKAHKDVEAAQRRSGCTFEWRVVTGDVTPTALLHCRYADIAVVGQTGAEGDDTGASEDMPETIALGSGRPVLIVPRAGDFQTIGERVLVAWSATRESTRALHDAMPILELAKSVTVMEVNPRRDPRHIAGADIAAHLARHGVKVEVSSITAGDIEVGDAILSRAADLGSDLLVMGAYGHSRLREFTFGGVTRHILQHMTLPVLMSH